MNLRTNWPWVLTVAILAAGVAAYALIPEPVNRGVFGDFVSGFVGALAFVWLIAAHLQQGTELRLQREELALQRAALNQQKEEFKGIHKSATLDQVYRVLEQFDASVRGNSALKIAGANDLGSAFVGTMPLWKTIIDSDKPQAVFEAYSKWLPIHGLCVEFLERVVSAIELYDEAVGKSHLPGGPTTASRIYSAGAEALTAIPYVRHYAVGAYMVSTNLVLMEPGINRLLLAGLEATDKLTPGAIKADGLADLRKKVAAHDAALAAAKRPEKK